MFINCSENSETTYMEVKTISPKCEFCKRLDVDTIGKEKYKTKHNPDGSTETVPDGYRNVLQCKYFEECMKIFEEGYHVAKDVPEPPINPVIEEHKEEIEKIEKKSTIKKPSKKVVSMSPSAIREREKEQKKATKTTKKAAAKK